MNPQVTTPLLYLEPGEPDGVVFFVPFEHFVQDLLFIRGDDIREDAVQVDPNFAIGFVLKGLRTQGLQLVPDAARVRDFYGPVLKILTVEKSRQKRIEDQLLLFRFFHHAECERDEFVGAGR